MSPEKPKITYLLRFLLTRSSTVKEMLWKSHRYEEFQDEIARWRDSHLNGDPHQVMSAEAISEAADALFAIIEEFEILQFEEAVGSQRALLRGAVRTRGGALKTGSSEIPPKEQV